MHFANVLIAGLATKVIIFNLLEISWYILCLLFTTMSTAVYSREYRESDEEEESEKKREQ
jgi:hypothetical protein